MTKLSWPEPIELHTGLPHMTSAQKGQGGVKKYPKYAEKQNIFCGVKKFLNFMFTKDPMPMSLHNSSYFRVSD